MNTMQLSCFVEVASQLSFSRAAEALHVSQPTVSHQIQALETELGCSLLVRSTRSVRLTDEGIEFLATANEMLALADQAKRRVARGGARSADTLRIGVTDGMEAQLLAPVMGRIHREDAAFDPVLRMGPYSALCDMLETGMIDVMLAYRDPDGDPAGATVFRRVIDVPVACVYSDQHPLAACERETVGLDELAEAGRIAVVNPRMSPAAIVRAQRDAGLRVDPERMMMCQCMEIALALAHAGVAFTLMADIPAMHRAELNFVPVKGLGIISLGVRTRRGRRPALVDRFIDVLGVELLREP